MTKKTVETKFRNLIIWLHCKTIINCNDDGYTTLKNIESANWNMAFKAVSLPDDLSGCL